MAHKHPLRRRIKRALTREVYILGAASIISIVSGVVASLTNIWNYVYIDDFGLSPANASLAASNLNIPWTIKPLWGILCDNVPIFGYRRKSYLIIMSILGFAPLFVYGLGTPATGILGLGILLVLHFSMAFQSVIGQALVAENSQEVNKRSDITEEEKTKVASRGVSLFFGCKYFGQIIFSVISTVWLTEERRHIFLFYTSFILITVFAASFIIPEKSKKFKRRDATARLGSLIEVSLDASLLPILPSQQQVTDLENRSPLENLKKTWNFVKLPVVYQSMMLAFLGNFAPGFTQPKFSYYTKHLGFDASFMSTLTLLTSVATVCGIILYDRCFRNINIKKYYTCTIILYFLLKLSLLLLIFRISTDIGIPDKLFAGFDQFVTDLGGELNALPVLILACRICPKNIEATIFSLLLAFNNASGLLSADMGAGIVSALGITNENFDNLWVTSVVAAVCQLLPFLVLFRIDYKKAIKMAEESHKQGQEVKTPADVDGKEKENGIGFPIEQDEGLGQNHSQSQERELLQKRSSI